VVFGGLFWGVWAWFCLWGGGDFGSGRSWVFGLLWEVWVGWLGSVWGVWGCPLVNLVLRFGSHPQWGVGGLLLVVGGGVFLYFEGERDCPFLVGYSPTDRESAPGKG